MNRELSLSINISISISRRLIYADWLDIPRYFIMLWYLLKLKEIIYFNCVPSILIRFSNYSTPTEVSVLSFRNIIVQRTKLMISRVNILFVPYHDFYSL